MRARFLTLVRWSFATCSTISATALMTLAQTPPTLGIQFSVGHVNLTISGTTGTIYSVQYTDEISPTNHWINRTLLQVRDASTVWTEPSSPTQGQRFYRAVSVPAPANTNLVFIQPGTFLMGSPTSEPLRHPDETQHLVTLSRGFWMGKFLVTQADYLSVAGTNPSYFTPANGYSLDLSRPVETVTWFDASNYCVLRTQQERARGVLATNYAYRLPTESEWEYATRAGTTTVFYLGNSLRSGQANFDGVYEYDAAVGEILNTNGISLLWTTPVGTYSPNAWGLYDLIGNVWEWCEDWYGPYPTGTVIDPPGAAPGSYRVYRGGTFVVPAWHCRSAERGFDFPANAYPETGLRVVLAQEQ